MGLRCSDRYYMRTFGETFLAIRTKRVTSGSESVSSHQDADAVAISTTLPPTTSADSFPVSGNKTEASRRHLNLTGSVSTAQRIYTVGDLGATVSTASQSRSVPPPPRLWFPARWSALRMLQSMRWTTPTNPAIAMISSQDTPTESIDGTCLFR